METRSKDGDSGAAAQNAAADGTDPPPAGGRELAIVNSVAEALNRSPDVQQALARTLALVADLLGLQTGWVWLLDDETGEFYCAAAQDLPPYLQQPVHMLGHSCWCIDLYREGRLPPCNVDMLTCSRLRTAPAGSATEATRGLRCHASIPLYFGEKPLGIMNVASPSWRELTPEELRLLSTIAYQVGIAVERARLAEESARLARLEERTRIAREIHDTLAQGLTAILLHVEGALHHLDTDPARARRRLESALGMARRSLEDARESVIGLRAAPLQGKPLEEALSTLARSFTSETGVRVRVSAAVEQPLPAALEAELFAIAREALANIRRHSGAGAAVLKLRATGRRVRLSVRDGGSGFSGGTSGDRAAGDPEPGDPTAGRHVAASHGLTGMRERAGLIGGRLRIASIPGRGTVVGVVAPLPAERPSGASG